MIEKRAITPVRDKWESQRERTGRREGTRLMSKE